MNSTVELESALSRMAFLHPLPESDACAQNWIDYLDEKISSANTNLELRGTALRRLRALCRRTNRLPSSCVLLRDIFFDRHNPLSRSALSDVYQGEHRGKVVALKSLRLHLNNVAKVMKAFHEEVVVWKLLRHRNITPFLGVSDVLQVCLISKWMEKGTIDEYLVADPNAKRVELISHIVAGLTYMHTLGLVHGDIKPANILVDQHNVACLTDFGLAVLLYDSGDLTGSATGGPRGTVRWIAPEVLSADASSEHGGRPSVASDIYAAAMVIWQLYSGEIPFQSIRREYSIIPRILAGERPTRPRGGVEGLSDSLWAVIQRAWLPDPLQRPDLRELLSAAWILHEELYSWDNLYNPSIMPGLPDRNTHVHAHGSFLCWSMGRDAALLQMRPEGFIYRRVWAGDGSRVRFSTNGKSLLVNGSSSGWHMWDLKTCLPTVLGLGLFKRSHLAILPAQPGESTKVLACEYEQPTYLSLYDCMTESRTTYANPGQRNLCGDIVTSADGKIAAIIPFGLAELEVLGVTPLEHLASLERRSLAAFLNLHARDLSVVAAAVQQESINILIAIVGKSGNSIMRVKWDYRLLIGNPVLHAIRLDLPYIEDCSDLICVYSRNCARTAISGPGWFRVCSTETGAKIFAKEFDGGHWPHAQFIDHAGNYVLVSPGKQPVEIWRVETAELVLALSEGGGHFVNQSLIRDCFADDAAL